MSSKQVNEQQITKTVKQHVVKSKPPIQVTTKRLSTESNKPRNSTLSKCDLNEKFKKVKSTNNIGSGRGKQLSKRISYPLTGANNDEMIEQLQNLQPIQLDKEQPQQQNNNDDFNNISINTSNRDLTRKSVSFKSQDLSKYTNGLEPKILKEYKDPITGKYTFFLGIITGFSF